MVRWIRYGPHAVLLRLTDTVGEEAFRRGRAIMAELTRHPPAGLAECVPGFTTLLLRFDPSQAGHLPQLAEHIVTRISNLAVREEAESSIKKIPVVYDGEDLAAVAEARALTTDEVVQLHSGPVYQVRLLGFTPGFPYLGELNPRLHTPRRAVPRPRVAAGSVAIGGEHTGIYSIDSPGGWHIIGRTSIRLFLHDRVAADTDPRDVFFLQPGDRVRFVPVQSFQDPPAASSTAGSARDLV